MPKIWRFQFFFVYLQREVPKFVVRLTQTNLGLPKWVIGPGEWWFVA